MVTNFRNRAASPLQEHSSSHAVHTGLAFWTPRADALRREPRVTEARDESLEAGPGVAGASGSKVLPCGRRD